MANGIVSLTKDQVDRVFNALSELFGLSIDGKQTTTLNVELSDSWLQIKRFNTFGPPEPSQRVILDFEYRTQNPNVSCSVYQDVMNLEAYIEFLDNVIKSLIEYNKNGVLNTTAQEKFAVRNHVLLYTTRLSKTTGDAVVYGYESPSLRREPSPVEIYSPIPDISIPISKMDSYTHVTRKSIIHLKKVRFILKKIHDKVNEVLAEG